MTFATFLQRISGAVIDAIIFLFIASVLLSSYQSQPYLLLFYFLVLLITALGLSIMLSVRYSGSPGNLLLNCQILDASSGNPISFHQGALRAVGLFMTIATLGVGYVWILFNDKKQALHDRFADTVVVYNGFVDMFDDSQKSLRQLMSEVR